MMDPEVVPGAKRTREMRPLSAVKFMVRMYPPGAWSISTSDVSDSASASSARRAAGPSVLSGSHGVCSRAMPLITRMVSSSVARSTRGRLGSRFFGLEKIAW